MKKIISVRQDEPFDLYSVEAKIKQALEKEGFISGAENYKYANKPFTLVIEAIENI